MEKKNRKAVDKTMDIPKTERLISFEEYFLNKNVRRERLAAFKIKLNGKLYNTMEQWDKLFNDFEK